MKVFGESELERERELFGFGAESGDSAEEGTVADLEARQPYIEKFFS
jgi:hypothetical protein